ncbi:MAG: hypothetical protein FWE84_04290 [Firmicutes bacterium]|nr:hypothetical protein [Bacillota bacterium]
MNKKNISKLGKLWLISLIISVVNLLVGGIICFTVIETTAAIIVGGCFVFIFLLLLFLPLCVVLFSDRFWVLFSLNIIFFLGLLASTIGLMIGSVHDGDGLSGLFFGISFLCLGLLFPISDAKKKTREKTEKVSW